LSGGAPLQGRGKELNLTVRIAGNDALCSNARWDDMTMTDSARQMFGIVTLR